MREVLTFVLLSAFGLTIHAQHKSDSYVIATIEKKTTSNLHPIEFDYWIISESMWESEEKFIPLYIDGFSQTDLDECCLSDTLTLFNMSSDESFDFQESFKKSVDELRSIVATKRQKIHTVKKKWKGYKEKINVYLTPVKGTFCICELRHIDDNTKLGYFGKTAVPLDSFAINEEFWESKNFKDIRRFDYTTLPFLSLQTIQF